MLIRWNAFIRFGDGEIELVRFVQFANGVRSGDKSTDFSRLKFRKIIAVQNTLAFARIASSSKWAMTKIDWRKDFDRRRMRGGSINTKTESEKLGKDAAARWLAKAEAGKARLEKTKRHASKRRTRFKLLTDG